MSEQGRTDAAAVPGAGRIVLLASAIALAGETVVLFLALRAVSSTTLLIAHAAVVLAVAVFLYRSLKPGDDLALPLLMLLLVACAGPAGALAMAGGLLLARGRAPHGEVLEDWYDRLAAAGKPLRSSEVYERIVSGRMQRLDPASCVNYVKVIESGTLDQRQRALGLIARQFHPDYTPALNAALRSREPVVRVQAAAVVARVREDLKARVKALTEAGESGKSPALSLADIAELQTLQRCDLVDPVLRAQCRTKLQQQLADIPAGGESLYRAARSGDCDMVAALETFLISEKRFKDLRVLRRMFGIVSGSPRRLRRRAPHEAAR